MNENSKSQIPNPKQTPNLNLQPGALRSVVWNLMLGVSLEFLGLGFENLACDRQGTTNHGQPTTDNEQ